MIRRAARALSPTMKPPFHHLPKRCRTGPALALLAGLVAALDLAAQSLSTALDPVCRLPRLELGGGTTDDSVLVLRAGDDLDDPTGWGAVLELGAQPAGHATHWMDPEGRAARRRFYRLERQPRPPLQARPNFRLTDHRGHAHELLREGAAKWIAFVFTDNAGLAGTWAAVRPLTERYGTNDLKLWLLNPVEDRAALAAAAATNGVGIPVLHDAAQLVARTFGVTTAGEAVLLDAGLLTPLYRGPVADDCPLPDGGTVRQDYLADALAAAATNAPVTFSQVRPRGPQLALGPRLASRYAQDIAPLLVEKCANCHRPAGIGPWAMTNHAVIAAQAGQIRQNLLEGLMPPWHADPAHQRFANDFSLTPAEQARLVDWLDAGAPRGDGPDPLTAVTPDPNEGWPLGPPDAVLTIARQNLPATGEIPYRYLPVLNPFRTNVWLRAAVVRPGNKTVVHHALVFYARTLSDLLEVQAGLGGFFAGYVPGMDQVPYPAGSGKFVPAGPNAAFIFQMHYTANGAAATDQTQVGLYLAPAPPARELKTTAAYDTAFTLPPNARSGTVVAERLVTRDSLLHEMSPHMHYRGDWMRFEAIYPDNRSEILLNVPRYDFAWQALYRLTEAKPLPAGTRLRVTGGFDNTFFNPFNPDPAKTITFGEQTDDEMFIGYLNISEAR
jgi:hypothetical protein